MSRVLVLEINEVPMRVFRWYAQNHPTSTIAQILSDGVSGQTEVFDELGQKELYPSQTWATLATGVPLEKHGIYWYADPKPKEFPLYWQVAAADRSVGVVGSLHSSPIGNPNDLPGLKFCVPDVFAPTAETLPTNLQGIQAFSLEMASSNSRAVSNRSPLKAYLKGLRGAATARLQPATFVRLGRLATLVATGRIPSERLRTAQFMLMADIFERQLRTHEPDLAVMFTNHVAAAMHRYWFAAFPGDWDEELYDGEWQATFAGEIEFAMNELDRVVSRLLDVCRDTDRKLLIVSSMGQTGGEPLRDKSPLVFVVRSPKAFFEAIGVDQPFEVRAAMVPQISAEFDSANAARVQRDRLSSKHSEDAALTFDVSGEVLTVSYDIPVIGPDRIRLAGADQTASAAGGEIVAVKEHRNGMHHPLGSLICANSQTAEIPNEPVDLLEVAPAILHALELAPAPYHRTPTFTL